MQGRGGRNLNAHRRRSERRDSEHGTDERRDRTQFPVPDGHSGPGELPAIRERYGTPSRLPCQSALSLWERPCEVKRTPVHLRECHLSRGIQVELPIVVDTGPT